MKTFVDNKKKPPEEVLTPQEKRVEKDELVSRMELLVGLPPRLPSIKKESPTGTTGATGTTGTTTTTTTTSNEKPKQVVDLTLSQEKTELLQRIATIDKIKLIVEPFVAQLNEQEIPVDEVISYLVKHRDKRVKLEV